jgi:hypothetical protein
LFTLWFGAWISLPREIGRAKNKVKFKQLFSKSREINLLSAARFFLFGARDIWFVVGVPVYLYASGWTFTMVGTFLAIWTIGYGLVQAISEHTGGLVVLDPGNLYRVVKRLLADGLIAESDRDSTDAGERRKYYRITPLGGRVLATELDRLRHLVSATSTRQAVKRWTS